MDRHPGYCENAGNARLAQWESACLTRRWSQVQILHRALSGPERGGAGAGGRRHESVRGGAPPFRTARRFAPGIETPLRTGGALRRVPMHQCLLFVKGGKSPPFHTFPPRSQLRTADPGEARERLGTPTSGRHCGPQGRGRCAADGEKARPGQGTPVFTPAQPRVAGRNCFDPRRSAGTAWNADLRSALRPAGPRTVRRRWRKSAAGPGSAGVHTGTARRRRAELRTADQREARGCGESRFGIPLVKGEIPYVR